MASIVIEHLVKLFPTETLFQHKTGVAFVYCEYKMHDEQKAIGLLTALLKQLLKQQQSIPDHIEAMYKSYRLHDMRPTLKDIKKALFDVIKWYTKVFIVVDALDECGDVARHELLSQIRIFQEQSQTKLMATSREIGLITQTFDADIRLKIEASSEDVEQYLESHMSGLPNFVAFNPDLKKDVKLGIIKAVRGM
jgi:hypothetical protein